MENLRGIARNVELWIFGAFGALVLVACLDKPAERSALASPARPASAVGVARETELALPQAGSTQAMYVVYVVGKRPSAAEKRAGRAGRGSTG